MTQTATYQPSSGLDAVYQGQRARLMNTVVAASAAAWAGSRLSPEVVLQQVLPIVRAGQQHTVALVDAYMAAKSRAAIGEGTVLGLDPARYTVDAIRGIAATDVYQRPFRVAAHAPDEQAAATSGQAVLEKLVRTDLQLAQTHSARDWMGADGTSVAGWRRVLTGPTSCALCTAASTRTYHTADLMPIHERCDCIVEPVWGDHDTTSIGAPVRVEQDPEIGPRLMADGWAPVGPVVV